MTTPALQVLAAVLSVAVPHPQGPASGMGGVPVWDWRPPPRLLVPTQDLLSPEEVPPMATPAQAKAIVAVALHCVRARESGRRVLPLGGGEFRQLFAFGKTGLCARAVRQWYEVGGHLLPHTWRFGAGNAVGMAKKLAGADCGIAWEDRQPGDILTFDTGGDGHVALYGGMVDGKEVMFENTSANRGCCGAGTTMTRITRAIGKTITGVWRPELEVGED